MFTPVNPHSSPAPATPEPSTPKTPKSKTAATPKKSAADQTDKPGPSVSFADAQLMVEILVSAGQQANASGSTLKFNWASIAHRLDLPSAGAAYVFFPRCFLLNRS